ncbi:uncharacterized protein LOC135831540 [Planococcus citri]|uniref:uncharacterized protein LOC135831540 n=1 Tax=Planococcus citri TaxID=170843 RepID=UPI0031F8E375
MTLSFETSSDESENLTTTSIDEQTSIESCKNGSTSNTRKRKRNKLNEMTVRVVGGSLNDKISGLLDSLADCKQDIPSILGQLFPKNEPELQYGYLIHEIIQKAIDIEKPENCVEIYANLCVQIEVHVRDKEGPEKLEFVNVLVEKCKEHIDEIQRKEHQVKIQKNKVDAFSIPQKRLLEEIQLVFEMQYLLDDNKLKIYKKSMCRFIIALCKVEMPKSEDIGFYFIMKSKSPIESLLTTIGKQIAIKLVILPT